ncbi:MAG: SapC family protein [Gammaproteobacteria bacterium]|nr:SapC family protein [Gammaproteobacteria bacterium]
MYNKIVPIQSTEHADLCVDKDNQYRFAETLDSAPLLISEFSLASKYYGIVFIKSKENIIPVVLLAYEQNRNLYINEDYTWSVPYVPAFLRRYPFILSKTLDENMLSLCIDMKYQGCNHQGKGEHLFTQDGENTKYLNDALKFVKEFQAQYHITEKFTAKLESLGLLTPMNAELKFASGKTASLGGFMLVNIERLKNLPEDKLKELVMSDELALIYMHINSLLNIKEILNLRGRSISGKQVSSRKENSKKKVAKKKTNKTSSSKKVTKKAGKKTNGKAATKKASKSPAKKAAGKKITKKSAKKKKKKN